MTSSPKVPEPEAHALSSALQLSRTQPKSILDLPDELLEGIFVKAGSYRNIESIGNACRRFEHVCTGIVRRGYMKFEVDVETQIKIAKSTYDTALSSSTVPRQNKVQLLNLFYRIRIYEAISSQFSLLKALAQSVSLASTKYNACISEILDTFLIILTTVKTSNASPTSEQTFHIMLEQLRWFTSKYDEYFIFMLSERFHRLQITEHAFGNADAQDMMAGVTILSILEVGKDISCNDAWIRDDGECSRVRVRYVVNRSWFRVDKSPGMTAKRKLVKILVHLVEFIKGMVTIINQRYTQTQLRQRYKMTTGNEYPGDGISFLGGYCSIDKDYTYSEDCEKQTLLYRYQNPVEDDYLEKHSGIQLDIDVTCPNEYIPRSLIAKCKSDCTMTIGQDCSFDLAMSAYQFYSENTLSYGKNRSLNRRQSYEARSRMMDERGKDEDVVEKVDNFLGRYP